MGKFKIEEAPTFTADVAVLKAGGGTIKVPFTFRYFSQDALMRMRDEWQQRREAAAKEVEGNALRPHEIADMRIELEVRELLDVIDAWEFEDACNEDGIRKFVNAMGGNYHGAMEAFFGGLIPAKLGN